MGGVASAIGNIVAPVSSSLGGLAGGVVGGLAGGIIEGANLGNTFQGTPAELIEQQDLLAQIAQGQANVSSSLGSQEQLAKALLAQSQGQGPNPAQLMMKQAQERANLQAAGLIGGAKGISPALAARMAAQQQAAGNQAVTQQAGILGAQQQLAAQQQLGGLYESMGRQGLSQQQLAQQALAEQNRARIDNQMGAQGISARSASEMAQTRGQIVGGLLGGAGAMAGSAIAASNGGRIPGKAQVAGDSYANDTVPAMLSPGEIVIPRSKAQDADSAKAFIDYLMGQEGKRKKRA